MRYITDANSIPKEDLDKYEIANVIAEHGESVPVLVIKNLDDMNNKDLSKYGVGIFTDKYFYLIQGMNDKLDLDTEYTFYQQTYTETEENITLNKSVSIIKGTIRKDVV